MLLVALGIALAAFAAGRRTTKRYRDLLEGIRGRYIASRVTRIIGTAVVRSRWWAA